MPKGSRVFLAAFLVTLPAAVVMGASPGRLSSERVREAIQWGLVAPEADLVQYAIRTDRTWLVNFDTPFLRVAQFSRAMKIQNAPVSEGDVSPKIAADEVHVYAHARPEATKGRASLPNIDHLYIVRSRAGTYEIIQPSNVMSFVRRVPMGDDWSGPPRISRSVKAAFPPAALTPGNEVRVVFESGEVQSIRITEDTLSRVR